MPFKRILCVVWLSVLMVTNVTAEEWTKEKVIHFDTRKVLATLGSALSIHDEIPALEPKKLIGRDQVAANRDLDKLVQEAMGLLGSASMNALRNQYRNLENRVAEEKQKLTKYRAERVLAVREDRSLRTRMLPGESLKSFVAVTKADFDMLIEAAESNIVAYEEDIAKTLSEMSLALNAIGIDLSSDQLEAMMSSVVGDDIMDMSVVFNAIKEMTNRLAELTQESGEDLTHAKRYYGMVVILHKIIGSMQDKFVSDVDRKYLPKLEEYRKSAQDNIKESRDLLKSGANTATVNNNIKSNELTISVIDLYASQLKSQREKVLEASKINHRDMRVADNTYKTVSVSSAVVTMIREGSNTFEHLISLQMPDVREFRNEQVREEFRNLTARMAM